MPAHVPDDVGLDGLAYTPLLEPSEGVAVPAADVVVSGISCRLPESDNMSEFREHLVNGDDMVTEDNRRWTPGMYGLPKRSGKLKDLSKFDAAFFGVHPKQANSMDPQLRLLLEVTYEAILDAGVSPPSIRGSRTGVFIGCSASEAHDVWTSDSENIVGYEMTGCTRSMFANRLSYFFDFKGPSFAIDTACSSSLLALDQAVRAIRTGQCDAAVVGGASLCLNPHTTLQFQKLGMLSPDGACKSFDASGNGYCRSEGVVAIYIQKSHKANRLYANLVHSKSNSDGNKDQGITFPSGEVQKTLLTQVYEECGVDPAAVAYVEAHGTGTKVGDPQEINSITDVFCKKGRQGPLLIGSTKSNMGHPEPASGLAALAKVLIAMEDGYIPANLHYNDPNPDIPGLSDGRLKVVSERTKWTGGYVGVNSFGFGGSNVHVLLKSNMSQQVAAPAEARVPRLLTVAGRTKEAVEFTLDGVKEASSPALEKLVCETSLVAPSVLPYRGSLVVNKETSSQDVQKCPGEGRPIWFVFAGMGTQWHGMGRDMMALQVFRESIMKSDAVLKPHGLNLYDLLMNSTESTFNDSLNSFVGIASIQVALVDVLTSLGIKPDGIVGHSVGELGCAYADGGLTAQETVLAAYWRGRCVQEANLPPGGMAAVGLTWEEARRRCPDKVVPACHNAVDTVTISGPAKEVSDFVAELQKEGIFAKEVKSAGVAFHSRYMSDTAPALLAALKKVIKEKRPRTSRWISTSIPESKWSSDLAMTSSAEYHVNNLVSPVLFQEALEHVPDNAVTVEIAPHCLLQAILKRSLSQNCTFVGLMKRFQQKGLEFMLSNLGKLFVAGVNFDASSLFPAMPLPVPRGTPMLSPLIQWDHSMSWTVPKTGFTQGGAGGSASCLYEVSIDADSDDHYLAGHKIDGRVLFPATGYLVLAWRCLAKLSGCVYEDMPVAFENVHIHRATIMPKSGSVKFEVSITPGTGHFEVCESSGLVVSGRVYVPGDPVLEVPAYDRVPSEEHARCIELTTSDVYKELRLRGYDYGPTFQGILSASCRGEDGNLCWTNNWISFLDTMLQFQVLSLSGGGLRLPTRIKSLKIDPRIHQDTLIQIDSERQAVKVVVDKVLDSCVAGGVEILGLHATVAPRRQQTQAPPVLEKYQFIPYNEHHIYSEDKELHRYANVCQSYLKKHLHNLLENGIKNQIPNSQLLQEALTRMNCISDTNTEKDIEQMMSANADKCSLLHLLHKVFALERDADFMKNAKEMISAATGLQSDQLLSVSTRPRMLKSCVDVVLENCTSFKLKVVEYCQCRSPSIYRHVLSYLNTQPMVEVEYILTGAGVDDLTRDQQLGDRIKTVPWDGKGDPPQTLKGADLLVLDGVICHMSDTSGSMDTLPEVLREGGFVLVLEPTNNLLIPLFLDSFLNDLNPKKSSNQFLGPYCDVPGLTRLLEEANLKTVATKSDSLLNSVFLCRKPMKCDPKSTVIEISDLDYSWVESVRSAMIDPQDSPPSNIWLVARSDKSSGAIGMVNCLRKESGGERIRCLLAESTQSLQMENYSEFPALVEGDLVMNISKNSVWGSYRHIPHLTEPSSVQTTTEHAFVNVLTRGDLSSLRWIESPLKYFRESGNQDNKALCDVYYTSLNFRDIMLATGKLPPDAIPGDLASQDCLLGMEFSGRDEEGVRVMGLLPAKGLATKVDSDRRFLWHVPDSWTLEQAASVPVVYATVYYALVVRGRIKRGDKVLVHSGSGGVGQAAISVALHHGCQVYTTVGSLEKRRYLKERFPQLNDGNFANSRDRTFEWDILRATGGRGVDVILNSLAEEKLQASLRILAQHGRFLEIGKVDLSNNSNLGMSVFLKNITFHGILLDALFDEGNADWPLVASLLSEGIQSGAVRPLNTTSFDKEDVEAAFRFMAQGKHIGKVVIKIRDEEPEKITSPPPVLIPAIARSVCHPHKTYIITGGLGGFGLELADWLIKRGAQNLVLTSRSGIRSGYQSRCVYRWREAGVQIQISARDVSDLPATARLIEEAEVLGKVGGVFHLAMVLKDGFMENQSQEDFQKVGGPKVAGTVHLDQVTRGACTESLDWFVVFSSVSCGRGNAGQANYGFANSFMERICEDRRQAGLPGLAVQWGAIGDVGVVLDTMGSNDTVIGGTLPQRINSCLATLDQFLNQPEPVVSSFVLAEKQTKGPSESNKGSLLDSVCNILGLKDSSGVNPDVTLGDLGLDSLMGVEVKQTLERDYDLNLPMRDIRLLTMNKLEEISGSPLESDRPQSSPEGRAVTSRYDLKEIMPKDTVVPLSKQGSSDKSPLYVVHPIEGVVASLREVMGQVDRPVYGLQCTKEAPMSSVTDLAQHYIKSIQSRQPCGPYTLAGYSFGACVAFEMSLQLQASGHAVADLVLLDASHLYVAAHTQLYRKKLNPGNDAEAESEALCAFLHQFITISYPKLTEDFVSRPDFCGRLDAAVGYLPADRFSDRAGMKTAAESFYRKLCMAEGYVAPGRLSADVRVTLIRAKVGHDEAQSLGRDYGLGQVCTQEPSIHEVDGNHESFILDDGAKRVAEIINRLP